MHNWLKGSPVQGCPIRDDGRIIRFSPITLEEAGSATIRITVIHSAADASWSRMLSQNIRLVPIEEGAWGVAEFLETAVT